MPPPLTERCRRRAAVSKNPSALSSSAGSWSQPGLWQREPLAAGVKRGLPAPSSMRPLNQSATSVEPRVSLGLLYIPCSREEADSCYDEHKTKKTKNLTAVSHCELQRTATTLQSDYIRPLSDSNRRLDKDSTHIYCRPMCAFQTHASPQRFFTCYYITATNFKGILLGSSGELTQIGAYL